jgi:CRP/FNR family cyclic AMP-dependent transcriptional regulator
VTAGVAASRVHERNFPEGSVIFRQGDRGDDMFVVTRGRVRLTIGSGGHETVVNELGPGAFFGEMTLLGGVPRSATAVAVGDTALLRIDRDVFAIMVQDDLDVVFRMLETIRGRLAAADERFETLAARVERARVLAELLRRALAADDAALADVAAACGASAEAVAATVAEHGLATQSGRVTVAGDVRRLADALARALARDRA